MPRKPSRRTYAETVGEISIEWNYLERRLHVVAFHYLKGDPEIASRIFAGMGNVSFSDFLTYLCQRFEPDKHIRNHVLHLIKAFYILRENRNIIEHSVPSLSAEAKYLGSVQKSNRIGVLMAFEVPIKDLKQILHDIREYKTYSTILTAFILDRNDMATKSNSGSGATPQVPLHKLAASFDKLPLPRKINPIPHLEGRPFG